MPFSILIAAAVMNTSIVLPCYNPADGWVDIIRSRYAEVCERTGTYPELVLVNDGSTKGVTPESVSQLREIVTQFKYVCYPENKGKGYAIRRGVEEASGDIILYIDVDFPYSNESIAAVYDALREGSCDVAVGVKDLSYYDNVPFLRRVISKWLRFMIRSFLSMPVTDTQCGLKGMVRSVKPLFLQTTIDRYLFDLEFIRNCFRAGKRVKAIPVKLIEGIHFRKMNYQLLLPELMNFLRILAK